MTCVIDRQKGRDYHGIPAAGDQPPHRPGCEGFPGGMRRPVYQADQRGRRRHRGQSEKQPHRPALRPLRVGQDHHGPEDRGVPGQAGRGDPHHLHGQLLQDPGPQDRPPDQGGHGGLRVTPVHGHGPAHRPLQQAEQGGAHPHPPVRVCPADAQRRHGHPPAAGEERGSHLRGHPRPERRLRRPASPGHVHVHLRPVQRAGGEGAAVQGHLDAADEKGRPGLQLPGHRRGGDHGHVGQRPPGGKAVHLPLQGPGQLYLRLLPAL